MSGRVMKTNLKRLEGIAYDYRNKPLTDWPRAREIAKMLGVSIAQVIALADNESLVLDVIVGLTGGGAGGGGEFPSDGDYLIEWIGE